jgi:hypothetical protein
MPLVVYILCGEDNWVRAEFGNWAREGGVDVSLKSCIILYCSLRP